MKNENIAQLLEKLKSGKCTPEEKLALKAWLHGYNMEGGTGLSDDEFLEAKANMLSVINSSRFPVVRKIRLWPRIAVAAAVAVVVFGAGLFYYSAQHKIGQTITVASDIAPGHNGATLTLANGEKILINEALAGNIATQPGVKISKTADGELIYELTANDGKNLTYNTLTTTRGEQTRVRLPDGTLVFLNSASTLKYPTSFGKERNVELTGEAYFQVAHNKAKPFKVISNGQEVEVLGTHFNINSYTDEKDTRTTLLEGSVRLNSQTILKPGEQAILSKSGGISVEQTNVDDVIAWTDGKFIFDSESIESIMRKLSRWYDVEVVYEGNVKDKQFAGTLSRKDNISKILDKIKFTQAAHFKIVGRRITVMP